MAVNGQGGYAPVLAALSTMQSNVERSQKSQAHEYLEKFQKSVSFNPVSKCFLHLLRHPSIARGMDNDKCYAFLFGGHVRSQAFRRHDNEGQSTHPRDYLDITTAYSYS